MASKQQWRKIAEAFEQYANGAPRTNLTSYGLCGATEEVGSFYGDFPMDYDPYQDPARDISRPKQHPSGFWWPRNRKGAAKRAIFATLMAEVSD